jgi:cytochrome P450
MRVPSAPGALPVLGHLRQLLSDPTTFLTSLPAHGDIVRIRLGTRPTYVVCRPELVSRVLIEDRRHYDKGGPFFDNVAQFFGDGLATCPDARQPRLRRLVQPAFARSRLAGYAAVIGREAAAALESWRAGQVLDAYPAMQMLALRITVSTMFAGWSAEPGASGDTLRQVDTLVSGAFLRMVAPGMARLPLPATRRFEQARSALYARIERTVAGYRDTGADRGDLLSMLMAGDGTGDGLSDAELRDQVMTMFIAGIGTTAAMLAWTLNFLSLDRELDAAVAAEARDAEPAGRPLLSDVITETFRIRPAAWLFSRRTVSGTELGGHRLPAGADVLISPYVQHHLPEVFANPERFDPGRWAGTAPKRPMIPFGGGARQCVGRDFSLMAITLVLASILRTWQLLPAGRAVRMSGRSILEPRDLRLRLVRRPEPAR